MRLYEYFAAPWSVTAPYNGNPGWTARSSPIFAIGLDVSAGRTMVGVSMVSVRATAPASARRCSLAGPPTGGRPLAVPRDEEPPANNPFRLDAEPVTTALDDAPQRDDRRDAEDKADEEKQEPAPGRPLFAPRHSQDDFNDAATA